MESIVQYLHMGKQDQVANLTNASSLYFCQNFQLGKTYSICGGKDFKERGLIPRSIGLVFAQMKIRQKKEAAFKFTCKISFTEIYKECIYDLLDDDRRLPQLLFLAYL